MNASTRALVPLQPAFQSEPISKPRCRPTDALFVAQLFASKFQVPQSRDKRRAEPADANACYRQAAVAGTAPTGRCLSRKI